MTISLWLTDDVTIMSCIEVTVKPADITPVPWTPQDAAMTVEAGRVILPHLERVLDAFYEWLLNDPLASAHMPPGAVNRVKGMQKTYWLSFFGGTIDSNYIEDRQRVGRVHAVINLPAGLYVDSMRRFQILFQEILTDEVPARSNILTQHIARQLNLDATLVLQAYSAHIDVLGQQAKDNFAATKKCLQLVVNGDIRALEGFIDNLAPQQQDALRPLLHAMTSITTQANQIAAGDYQANIEARSENDSLGIALQQMTEAIREAKTASVKNDWLMSGLNGLHEAMLAEERLESIADVALTFLIKHLKAHMGAVYISSEERDHLIRVASYAFPAGQTPRDTVEFGEGLVGQVAKDQTAIFLTSVPPEHLRIQSSVLEAQPSHVIIQPIMAGPRLIAVLELASLHALDSNAMEFLARCSDSMATALESAIARQLATALHQETEALNEELQTQQALLRSRNEELEQQKLQLQRSEQILEQQQQELEATNLRLESQNQQLEDKRLLVETQNDELEQTRSELETKARNLAQASKYKSNFLANMSHELRTPLNSMLLLARHLADNHPGNLDAEQVEAATVVYNSGNDLLSLINEILDLAKIEAGHMKVLAAQTSLLSIARRLESQFSATAKDKGLSFQVEVQHSGDIVTDPGRLEQILRNLLSNAIKFTAEGSVRMTVTMAEEGRHPLPIAGPCWAVIVNDTGIGIPSSMQEAIFEAFQQVDGGVSRSFGGTGLGLSISRELARLLQAELELTSSTPQGSTFTLYMADYRAPDTGSSQPPSAHAVTVPTDPRVESRRHARGVAQPPQHVEDDRDEIGESDRFLLVIEDDVHFAAIVRDLCREQGFKVIHATTGEEGIQLAIERQPHGILLDIVLPGIDGWSVIDALKDDARTRHIPVHFASVEDQTLDGFRRGAVGHLKKPATREDVYEALTRLEQVFGRVVKELLLIEDDAGMRSAISMLLGNGDIKTTEADSGARAIELLESRSFDCVILDIGLPDIDGFHLLDEMHARGIRMPPVIVYTGRDLTEEETRALRGHAKSIIIKGVRSEERLLDETSIFLHRIVGQMPAPKQRIIKALRDTEDLLHGKRVLLVDDDMRNAFALSHILAEHGMSVTKAENGMVALRKIEESEPYDVVLMDIMMPVMNGFEAIQRIRSNPETASLPIIAITAKAMRDDREKCIGAGANDYLTKPIDLDRLMSALRVWLYR